MKIILSRKGFDSSVGEIPSVILPDGRLFSFPIPDKSANIRYSDIKSPIPEYDNLYKLIKDLYPGKRKFDENYTCHLDPDLNHEAIIREPGWKPLFGQEGIPLRHLQKEKVGKDDLFLFFGWFRQTEIVDGKIRYDKYSSGIHVIYGYFFVEGEININNPGDKLKQWMLYHPHISRSKSPNSIYTSQETATFNGLTMPGVGILSFKNSLVLTKPNQNKRSLWKLPLAFYPFNKKRTPLTSHDNINRWKLFNDHAELQSVYRGQEFVLSLDEYPELMEWVSGIIINNSYLLQ